MSGAVNHNEDKLRCSFKSINENSFCRLGKGSFPFSLFLTLESNQLIFVLLCKSLFSGIKPKTKFY